MAFGREDPIGKGLTRSGVHPPELGGIHGHDVVDVVEERVVFDKDRQANALGLDEIGAPVSQRMSLELPGDIHGEALALPGLAIPGLTFRTDSGLFPGGKLAHVRAGLVAARHERRFSLGDAPQRVGGRETLDVRRISGRTDDHKVVVHNKSARGAVSLGHPGLLGFGRVSQQHVAFPPSTLLQDVAAAADDWLHDQAPFLDESVGQDAQDSAILCGRRRKNDKFVWVDRLRHYGRGEVRESGEERQSEKTSKTTHAAGSCVLLSQGTVAVYSKLRPEPPCRTTQPVH